MKTIKQIADEIGVSKQRIYRFIRKNRISDVHHDTGVMWCDDVAQSLIKQHFTDVDRISDVYHDVHHTVSSDTVVDTVIAMLQRELEAKNTQISALQSELAEERKHSREQAEKLAVLADQAQQLHLAGTLIDGQKMLESGEKKWWQFWRGEKI